VGIFELPPERLRIINQPTAPIRLPQARRLARPPSHRRTGKARQVQFSPDTAPGGDLLAERYRILEIDLLRVAGSQAMLSAYP
jgi:hypothetical protein